MKQIGFLHTSPVHIKTFNDLLQNLPFEINAIHVVAESLLEDARKNGLSGRIKSELIKHLAALNQSDLIICTCSTLADMAEQVGQERGQPIVRVDRPMIEAAVLSGQKIAVLYTVESTLQPTLALIDAVRLSLEAEIQPVVTPVYCEGAWELFERDDIEGYAKNVAKWLDRSATQFDTFILAQASMASAVDYVPHLSEKIFSSPQLAVEYALVRLFD
ncbi:MAG: hypothetical protein QNJ45_18565 [Ardenticatenaceae bacterium]|nr:hypothetical protein [Ardenticatenaceae bacterium]